MSDDRDPGPASHQPEFGPGGYLPERASKRARKIVLRAPMGVQWIIGAVVAGAVIVVAGLLWLAQSDDPPGPPWVAVGQVSQIDEALAVDELNVLVVVVGRPRAFTGLAELDLEWCAPFRRIDAMDALHWSLTGRAMGGAQDSLRQHPTRVHDGTLYIDPSVTVAGPPPAEPDAFIEFEGCPRD